MFEFSTDAERPTDWRPIGIGTVARHMAPRPEILGGRLGSEARHHDLTGTTAREQKVRSAVALRS